MSIHEQLNDIRTEIRHHQSTVKACEEKIKPLRATMRETREKIKKLKTKERNLIFSTIGVRRK